MTGEPSWYWNVVANGDYNVEGNVNPWKVKITETYGYGVYADAIIIEVGPPLAIGATYEVKEDGTYR